MAHGVELFNAIGLAEICVKNLEGFKQLILVESVEPMLGPRK